MDRSTVSQAITTKRGRVMEGGIPGLPPGGFRTILADPPWQAQSGEAHYQTMSLERIMGMPVVELAAADAHLWLWTTNALLPRAYEVAQAWGFTVRSPLTWVKFRLGLSGRYQLRNATEQLLFCTRGKAPLGSHPSQPGLTHPSPNILVSQRSSSPSLSGSAKGHSWSCSPVGGRNPTRTGRSGAMRWCPMCGCRGMGCRATALALARSQMRHRRQHDDPAGCERT